MLTAEVSSCAIDPVHDKLIYNYLLESREIGDQSIMHLFAAPNIIR